MQKITMIVGEPAVGKSHLVQSLLKLPVDWKFEQIKYIPHHSFWNADSKVIILGRYDEPHQFPGTDRMSMAAQPHVLRYIQTHRTESFIFEGDRLGNVSMLEALLRLPYVDIEVIYLTMNPELLALRRQAERIQSAAFLASRRTKLVNILQYCHRVQIPVRTQDSSETGMLVRHISQSRFQ